MRLETAKSNGIDNFQGTEISSFQMKWNKEIPLKHPNARRRTDPSPLYNCHGLTFASRRTRIEKNLSIKTILADDNYEEIQMKEILPGDIVIYYSDRGDPNHSGIVLNIDKNLNLPIIYSKWGSAGEFIHIITDRPILYGPIYKFYRCKL